MREVNFSNKFLDQKDSIKISIQSLLIDRFKMRIWLDFHRRDLPWQGETQYEFLKRKPLKMSFAFIAKKRYFWDNQTYTILGSIVVP